MKTDIIIIGGGASGLMAGIIAARNGSSVMILEQKEKPGKKILATGNGKCNYANKDLLGKYYYSDSFQEFDEILNQFHVQATIDFFSELGIVPKEKKGLLYPYSEMASAILDVLTMELEILKVKIKCSECVKRIEKEETQFLVFTENYKYFAQNVILSTGGCAYPRLGSDGSGYRFSSDLGHRIIPPVPALVGLKAKERYFHALAGIRVYGSVRLLLEEQSEVREWMEEGELQLTKYGVSGIPMFQISRIAARELEHKRRVSLLLDLMPSFSKENVIELLRKRIEERGNKTLERSFIGLFHPAISKVLIDLAGLDGKKQASYYHLDEIQRIADVIKGWRIKVIETNGFENAQVSAGGVAMSEIEATTMESKRVKGLYLTGELLDVDGICGGYNLQWAWTTGYIAGRAASRKKE